MYQVFVPRLLRLSVALNMKFWPLQLPPPPPPDNPPTLPQELLCLSSFQLVTGWYVVDAFEHRVQLTDTQSWRGAYDL